MKKLFLVLAVFTFIFCNTNKDNMPSARFIATITTSLPDNKGKGPGASEDLWIDVLNITRGLMLTSTNDDKQKTELYVIPANKRTASELKNQLEALKGVLSVAVVEISEPIRKEELSAVRNLYSTMGQNIDNIPDDSLALFIEDKLQEEYAYAMIPDQKELNSGRARRIIVRTEDVPGVTPDMLKHRGIKMKDLPSHPFTKDDFKTVTEFVTLENVSIEQETFEPPPPPPPPRPKNVEQMSDDELKRWLQKEHPHKPKHENISIKRTTKEIEVTITYNDGTEKFSYPLSKL